jgi:hypothetical protein
VDSPSRDAKEKWNHEPPHPTKTAIGNVSHTPTTEVIENSPPVQLVSPTRQNSTQPHVPVLRLNPTEEEKRPEKKEESSRMHPQEFKDTSSFVSSPRKVQNEQKDDVVESSKVPSLQTSHPIVDQQESPSTQVNDTSVPPISAKLKQKFLEYQRQRQVHQQHPQLSAPHQRDSIASVDALNSSYPSMNMEQNDKQGLKSAHNMSSPNHELHRQNGRDEVANRNSIQNEIAAVRELLESYRAKYTKDAFLDFSTNDVYHSNLKTPTTNYTSASLERVEEVCYPPTDKEAENMTNKQQEDHAHSSCVVVSPGTTFSKQQHSVQNSLTSSCSEQDCATNNLRLSSKDEDTSGSFFDRHSKHIQKLESALFAVYRGDTSSFLDLVSETSGRSNFVDMLFYCFNILHNRCDPNSTTNQNAQRIQNLEMKLLEERNAGEKQLRDMQIKSAAIRDEIEDYQAKLSRTQLAFQVASTEKRHLEHRYPSLQLCGSMEEEIGKLESRQEQRERKLQLLAAQKDQDIRQLEQTLADRDKEIGFVYSEITELLKNIEQVQEALKFVHA